MIIISIVIDILIDFLATSVTVLCTCWVLQPRFLRMIFFLSFLVLVGLVKKIRFRGLVCSLPLFYPICLISGAVPFPFFRRGCLGHKVKMKFIYST